MEKGDDPWEILGVPRSASEAEIKKAFRKGALKYHPDKQHTEEDKGAATKIFTKIAEAYQTLSDPVKRYDWKLAEEKRQKPAGSGNRTSFESTPSRSSTYKSSQQPKSAHGSPRSSNPKGQYPASHRHGAPHSPRRRRASVAGHDPCQQGQAPGTGYGSHQKRASVAGHGARPRGVSSERGRGPRQQRASVAGYDTRHHGGPPEMRRDSHQQTPPWGGRGPPSPGAMDMGRGSGQHQQSTAVGGRDPRRQGSNEMGHGSGPRRQSAGVGGRGRLPSEPVEMGDGKGHGRGHRRHSTAVGGRGPPSPGPAAMLRGSGQRRERASVAGHGPRSQGSVEMERGRGHSRQRASVVGPSPRPQGSINAGNQFGGSRLGSEMRQNIPSPPIETTLTPPEGAAWRRQYWKNDVTAKTEIRNDPFDIFDQVMKEEFGENYKENDKSGWQAAAGVPGLAKLKPFKRTSLSAGKEFKKLDTDKSKSISKDELEKFIESHANLWKTLGVGLGLSEERCIRIGTDVAFTLALGEGIHRPATNEFRRRKREISKEEFKRFHKNYVEDENGSHEFYLRTVFRVFDVNSDGVLNAQELDKFLDVFYNAKDMFRGKTKLPEKSELLRVAGKRLDRNRDGVLQFNEIRDLLHVAAVVATEK